MLAFRAVGWDHGDSSQDTALYFRALSDAGLIANSGLASGSFEAADWRIGNDPGHNLATVTVADRAIVEVSPTTGSGGYINPVLPHDLDKLAAAARDRLAVIVSVYHLGALQGSTGAQTRQERETLERHFQTVAELASRRVLYPVTLRELLRIVRER